MTEERGEKALEALRASNYGFDVANEGKLAPDRQMVTHFKQHRMRQNCKEKLRRLIP